MAQVHFMFLLENKKFNVQDFCQFVTLAQKVFNLNNKNLHNV